MGRNLPDGVVRAITIDKSGEVWLGTNGGVTRFDPRSARSRTYTQKDGLADDHVSAIAVEKEGTLWFGSPEKGVSRFDTKSDTWKVYTEKDGLAGDNVAGIATDDEHALWFATDKGVSRFDPGSRSWKTYTKKSGLVDDPVTAVAVDSEGALWFGTGRGASRFDPRSDSWRTYTKRDGLAGDSIATIATERGGALWFGTERGASRFDPGTHAWKSYVARDGLGEGAVVAVAEEPDGALWFGTERGASRFDPRNKSWKTYTAKDGLPGTSVSRLAVDGRGALWLGTSDAGVGRFDPVSRAWWTRAVGPRLEDGSPRTIAADGQGALWLTTLVRGVKRLASNGKSVSVYDVNDGFPHNGGAIAVGRDGTPWWGGDKSVARFDARTGSWELFAPEPDLSGDISAITVGRDGTIWFGTDRGALGQFDPESNSWKHYASREHFANQRIVAMAMDEDGVLWTCANGFDARALERVDLFDPETKSWSKFSPEGGFQLGSLYAMIADREGGILIGGGDGAGRYHPADRSWERIADYRRKSMSANFIAEDAAGVIYLGGFMGVDRYDPRTTSMESFTKEDSFPALTLSAAVDRDGALWLVSGMGGRVTRMVLGGQTGERGAVLTVSPQRSKVAWSREGLAVVGRNGLSMLDPARAESLEVVTLDATATSLAPGPRGGVWVGTELGGLALRTRSRSPEGDGGPSPHPGRELALTREQGLPGMTVTALAPVPDTGNTQVWVGTSGGAALVSLDGDALRVARKPLWEEMPTGPVDALAVIDDGTLFVAYNKIPAKRFMDAKLAARREHTRVFRVPAHGAVEEIPADEALARSEVRAIAYSRKQGLWVGTSAGLFVRKQEGSADGGRADGGVTRLVKETGDDRLPPRPIRHLAIAPDDTVWMSSDRQGDTPPLVVGYRPGTPWLYTLTQDLGIPKGDVIDDMTFTDDGNLVVAVDFQLAKGRVFVPVTDTVPARRPLWPALATFGLMFAAAVASLIVVTRRNFYLRTPLADFPFSALPATLASLRRYRALPEAWSHLGLPPSRIPLVETLASSSPPAAPELRALAALLGMPAAAGAEVRELPHGLSLLAARLPYLTPLRNHPLTLVALDSARAGATEPARIREAVAAALEQTGQRFEIPFVLLPGGAVARDLLPARFGCLVLGERERKALLFARSPEETFAGLLHTRGLLALSPYATAGEVKEEAMFFGRSDLRRELLLASSVQHIVVGPRRVGKTSLLKRLQHDLTESRPETETVFLNLLDVGGDHAKAARRLARTLKVEMPAAAEGEPETALVEILRARFQGSGKKGIVLVDEADELVEADAAKGFPLLAAMRALQAEGVASFVLAGYLYLYREALNQRSPLYNFATLRVLGPLDAEAARELSWKPMQRLGVAYADEALPAQIAARTGGYPSFVQILCNAVLKELSGGDLTVTEAHLARAERSAAVTGQLGDIFRLNAGPLARVIVYSLLDRETFSEAEAEAAVTGALGRAASTGEVDGALLELRLFGFVAVEDGRFRWAIPLLRDTLQAGDPARALARAVEELAKAPPPDAM